MPKTHVKMRMQGARQVNVLVRMVAVVVLAVTTAPSLAQVVLRVDDDANPGGDGATWGAAYRFLQDAIADASFMTAGGMDVEVWVAAGTYRPDESLMSPDGSGDTLASFELKSGMSVLGGFFGTEMSSDQRDPIANLTILSGDLLGNDDSEGGPGDDNSIHVVLVDGQDSPLSLDGFTVIGGNSEGDAPGSGIRCIGSSLAISSCVIRDCRGIAVRLGGIASGAILRDSVITNNTSHGVQIGPLAEVMDCRIEGNGGRGVYAADSDGNGPGKTVTRCLVVSNAGGGVQGFRTGMLVQNSRIVGNGPASLGGGGRVTGTSTASGSSQCNPTTSLTFVNCEINGNSAVNGGGFHATIRGEINFFNSTVVHNVARQSGGTGHLDCQGMMTTYNSIFSSNGSGITAGNTSGNCGFCLGSFGCGNLGGSPSILSLCSNPNENIVGDPMFRDRDGADNIPGTLDDDLRLLVSSPAVNAPVSYGGAGYCPPASTGMSHRCFDLVVDPDLAGNPRIQGGKIDIGAYEFTAELPINSVEWASSNSGGFFNQGTFWTGGAAPGPLGHAIFDIPKAMNAFQNIVFNASAASGRLTVESVEKLFFSLFDVNYVIGDEYSETPGEPSIIIGDQSTASEVEVRNSAGFTQDAYGLFGKSMALGRGAGAQGALRIVGPKVLLELSGESRVGAAGDGELDVRNDAMMFSQGDIVLGEQPDSSGLLRLGESGASGPATLVQEGLSINARRDFIVGAAGSGGVLVEGNAIMDQTVFIDEIVVAQDQGSVGEVTLSGPLAQWIMAPLSLVIGQSGNATVRILDGAQWTASPISPLSIAENASATALIEIDGVGSAWINNSPANIGGDGQATVRVTNGGVIEGVSFGIENGAALEGDGAVDGDVANFGTVRPFINASLLIDGDYDQIGTAAGQSNVESGALAAQVGPAPQMPSHLAVAGSAELAGSLQVEFVDGYEPLVGAPPVEVLSASLLSGRFDVALFPGLSADGQGNPRFMRVMYADGASATEGGPGVSIFADTLGADINLEDGATQGVTGLPQGVVVGDFDGFIDPDGNPTIDLALSIPGADAGNDPGEVVVLLNAGSSGGQWQGFTQGQTNVTVGADPRGLAVGSFTGGSSLDIAVANRGSDTVSILSNNGSGLFSVASTENVGAAPVALAAADFDGSGSMDLAVANNGADTVSVLSNDGVGGFTTTATLAAGASPMDVRAAGLISGLGPDIVVTNSGDDNAFIYANDGAGAFMPPLAVTLGDSPGVVQPGDLDNDKDTDLAVIDELGGTLSIVRNNGDGTFAPSAQLPLGDDPRSLALVDLDDDGDLDVAAVVTNDMDDGVVRILRNDFDGAQLAFAQFGDEAEGTNPLFVASGDVDGAGMEDLIVVSESTTEGPQEEGTAGALLGIGASTSGDLNGDGIVDGADLATLLSQWGTNGSADLNNDNTVNGADLAALLANWG